MRIQKSPLIKGGHIPLDIGWTMRMGLLDLINRKWQIEQVLEEHPILPNELIALRDLATYWGNSREVFIEDEFMYKCLKMANFEKRTKKNIHPKGTLATIDLEEDKVRGESLAKIAEIDGKGGGWSTGYIFSNMLPNTSVNTYMTTRACEAVRHWEYFVKKSKSRWRTYYQDNIVRQAENFTTLISSGRINFHMKDEYDYPFARAFELPAANEAGNRYLFFKEETEKSLGEYSRGEAISSETGCVIQALAMKSVFFGDKVEFKNPDAASKNWPQFWQFLKAYS